MPGCTLSRLPIDSWLPQEADAQRRADESNQGGDKPGDQREGETLGPRVSIYAAVCQRATGFRHDHSFKFRVSSFKLPIGFVITRPPKRPGIRTGSRWY